MEDWEVTQALANAMGLGWNYAHPREILAEIARLTPSFAGVSGEKLEQAGSPQWPVNDAHPAGSPAIHTATFGRAQGNFVGTVSVSPDGQHGQLFLHTSTKCSLYALSHMANTR